MPKKLLSTMTAVTGLPHHDAPDFLAGLQAGIPQLSDEKYSDYLPVVFVPEPNNSIDKKAIRIEVPGAIMSDGRPRKLGYIPAKANEEWHTFFFSPGDVARNPKVSAKIRIDKSTLSTEKGAMWIIEVHSPDPGLPDPISIPAPNHHNFQFQNNIWASITSRRPKRRKSEVCVWI